MTKFFGVLRGSSGFFEHPEPPEGVRVELLRGE